MNSTIVAPAASLKSARSLSASLGAAIGAVGRGIMAVLDGLVEGHRLQTQVLSRRGRHYIQD